MIISVLDIPENDTADHFIVDTDKLDLNDPGQKEYHDAIKDCLANTDAVPGGYSNELMIYNHTEWSHAIVTNFPVQIDGIATVWEGSLKS